MALQKVKKVKGKKVSPSPRIGFDKWNTESMEDFGAHFVTALNTAIGMTVDEMIMECLDIATREYLCIAFIDSKGVDTVTVELPLGESDEEGPQWQFSLVELIENEIDLWTSGYGGPISDQEDRVRLQALSDHLNTLRDLIGQALDRKVEAE